MDSLSSTARPPPHLPHDVLREMSQYLARPDLTSCTRVSKEWCNTFIPALWRTYQDSQRTRHGVFGESARQKYAVLHRYAKHIRHLTVCSASTIVFLASMTEACTRLCSLMIHLDCLYQSPLWDNIEEIYGVHRCAVQNTNFPKIEEALKLLADPTRSEQHFSQRRCAVAKTLFLLALRSAGTLTKLSFGDNPEIVSYFTSIQAFYNMLSHLPSLRELRIPGAGISVIALNRVLPCLQLLHLACTGAFMVAQYHRIESGWCLMEPVEADGFEGSSSVTPSIKKLIVETVIYFDELRRILACFHSIEEIFIHALSFSDFQSDEEHWNVLQHTEDIHIQWVIGADLFDKEQLDETSGPWYPLTTSVQMSLSPPLITPFLHIRRGDAWPEEVVTNITLDMI